MSDDIPFDRAFEAEYGKAIQLSPLIRRITAPNPGPYTYHGTNSYIIGRGKVAILDPGPVDEAHISALLAAVRGESVEAILVSHTHIDHSPAAALLRQKTGATIYAEGPHRPARPMRLGEVNMLDASGDRDFLPDVTLADGDTLVIGGCTLEAVFTPGHCANHMAFALREEQALFSADHVMAWSTTIVAPPDGAMSDFMASLAKLRGRDEQIFWPGHGGPVVEPARFMRALAGHRLNREAAILRRVGEGDATIDALVASIYEGIAPALRGAAALNVLAHLEDLVARGLVATDGAVDLSARYRRNHA